MPTLYVENVPKELYEALRERARTRRRSMAAEVLALLDEAIPTERELKAREEFLYRLERMRSKKPRAKRRLGGSGRRFPSTEQMQRDDRAR